MNLFRLNNFSGFQRFNYFHRLHQQFDNRFFERIVTGLYFDGACGAAGVGCCGDGRGADVPGGNGSFPVHRGIEVVRGAPRDGPVGRDSYLVAHIEPDGLPVEFRCILLFAPAVPAAMPASTANKSIRFISMSSEWFIFYQNTYRKVNINLVNNKYYIMDNCGKSDMPVNLLAVDSFGCGVSLWQGGMRIVPSGGFSGFRCNPRFGPGRIVKLVPNRYICIRVPPACDAGAEQEYLYDKHKNQDVNEKTLPFGARCAGAGADCLCG